MAEVLFKGIKDYGLLHSSLFNIDAVIEATRQGLGSMKVYLDARIKDIDHSFDSKTQNTIRKEQEKSCPSMGDYGSLSTKIWVAENEIKDVLFDNKKALQPMMLNYLDLPHIFRDTEDGFNFMYALNNIGDRDLDIFGLKSVQIMIDLQFIKWGKIN